MIVGARRVNVTFSDKEFQDPVTFVTQIGRKSFHQFLSVDSCCRMILRFDDLENMDLVGVHAMETDIVVHSRRLRHHRLRRIRFGEKFFGF